MNGDHQVIRLQCAALLELPDLQLESPQPWPVIATAAKNRFATRKFDAYSCHSIMSWSRQIRYMLYRQCYNVFNNCLQPPVYRLAGKKSSILHATFSLDTFLTSYPFQQNCFSYVALHLVTFRPAITKEQNRATMKCDRMAEQVCTGLIPVLSSLFARTVRPLNQRRNDFIIR